MNSQVSKEGLKERLALDLEAYKGTIKSPLRVEYRDLDLVFTRAATGKFLGRSE